MLAKLLESEIVEIAIGMTLAGYLKKALNKYVNNADWQIS